MSDGLDFLLEPPPPPPADTYRWATVTQLAPIRIQLDGDPAPVASEPVTLCPLRLGCRVWVQIHGRMMIILGVAEVPLPETMEWRGTGSNLVTATSWEPITSNELADMSVTVPSEALVEVQVSAWVISPASNDLRASIKATGATTIGPSDSHWGSVLWSGNGEAGASMQSSSRALYLNAGTTTLQLVAYATGAGSNGINYPVVTARVIEYK